MSISSTVRKSLWAQSGNKCAICGEILTKTQFGTNIICGEECHIVSAKPNGPRHRELTDYDVIENLILLCQEHHKMIDDNPEKFNEEYLKNLKLLHEAKNKVSRNENNLNTLVLTNVKDPKILVRFLSGAEQYATDFPSDHKKDFPLFEEFFELINDFDVLEDYSEFKRMEFIEPSFRKILGKGYFVLCGQQNNYGKYGLKTVFVFIRTKEQLTEYTKI